MTRRPFTHAATSFILLGLALAFLPSIRFVGDSTSAAAERPVLDCPPCADLNPCTVDTCDTSTGTCRYDSLNCDDGNPCTSDFCDTTPNFGAAGTYRWRPGLPATTTTPARRVTPATRRVNATERLFRPAARATTGIPARRLMSATTWDSAPDRR